MATTRHTDPALYQTMVREMAAILHDQPDTLADVMNALAEDHMTSERLEHTGEEILDKSKLTEEAKHFVSMLGETCGAGPLEWKPPVTPGAEGSPVKEALTNPAVLELVSEMTDVFDGKDAIDVAMALLVTVCGANASVCDDVETLFWMNIEFGKSANWLYKNFPERFDLGVANRAPPDTPLN